MFEFTSLSFFRGLFSRIPVRRNRRQTPPIHSAAIETLESRQLLTVTFHGGALLTNVEVQGVYLGSDWQSTSTLKTQTGQFDQFMTTLVSGQYMDMLTNAGYGVGRGTSSAGVIDNISLNKTSGVTDASIQQNVQAMISSGALQTPDANRLYVVYVEPGVVVYNGSDSSAKTFLGYHGAFAGRTASGSPADIHYVVIPYPDGVNPSHTSQGFTTAFNEQTAVTSHEIAESATDPNVNYKNLGWYDDQLNGEIGDLTRITVTYSGYVVQDVVDKNDRVISPLTTVTTLSAPQNVTVAAVSSTAALVSWNPATGTQGYRVFQVIGTQSVLLATLPSTATSVQIPGLVAGSTVSFKVEAYSGTAVADSPVVTVKLAPMILASPTLTGTILSSTTIRLNWTAVSGTDGYNLYWSSGGTRHYLGTVGASVTSVQVVGLVSSATYQFQVEAYHGSAVAASNWLSVNTGTHQIHSLISAASVELPGAVAMADSDVNRRSRRH